MYRDTSNYFGEGASMEFSYQSNCNSSTTELDPPIFLFDSAFGTHILCKQHAYACFMLLSE